MIRLTSDLSAGVIGLAARKAMLVAPLIAVIALLVLVPRWHRASVLAAGQQKSFEELGPMPGSCQGCDTYGSGLSADGSTVVGSAYVCPDGSTTCTSTGKTEAYRWTVAGGYQLLGDLNGSFGSSPSATGSAAFAASSDGSVVVGDAPVGSNSFGAFRWTAAQGMQPLPQPPLNQAFAISADASMIVGQFGWFNTTTGQTGTFGSTEPASGATPLGVDADGQIVVGDAGGAFRWTQVRRAATHHNERQSFAEIASAAMSLRCNTFVTVMKTAELRDCDDPADTRDLPREGALLVEPQMGPGPMVVTEIRSQRSLQMSRVQDDEVVQTFSTYRADQSFDVGVLPGATRRGE